VLPGQGLFAESNTTFGQIVRGQFDLHLIASKNFDVILSHFSGNVRDNFMAILQFHPEHGIR